MLQFLFIVNNNSGTSQANTWGKVISDFLNDKKVTFQIYDLPEHFTTVQIKDHIKKAAPLTIIAVGGDGTVTMLANIIAGSDVVLGILPAGSANGTAKELGIPENAIEALRIILNNKTKNCDLIKINEISYCLHPSDVGLNAQLIKHFDEGKLRRKLGYALVILKTLWHREKMQVAVKVNNTEVRRDAFMVVLANGTRYGTGAVINPEGSLNDGLFEVIIVKKLSPGALLKTLFNPRVFNPKNIEIIKSTSVKINMRRRMHFQIDGEYQGKIKHVAARICPGILKIIVPD